MRLRDYQLDLKNQIYAAWQRVENVLVALGTGGGKTVLFANILQEHQGVSVVNAHRQEIVGQISMELAECGVRHNVIAQKPMIRVLRTEQLRLFGTDFIHTSAPVKVAGVDTLINLPPDTPWFRQCTLWVQDEAHHLLRKNKWGRAARLFPNARGLGVTATPGRLDGRGLGAHADGVFNELLQGITTRQLIDQGYLSPYRIFCPPSDFVRSDIQISDSTGDFVKKDAKKKVRRSTIIGDVVEQYIKHASGKLGVTFTPGVETATDVAARFRQRGVPAEAISGKTPVHLRMNIIGRFRRREILQLVNDDIVGEGFDCPAIEVVSMLQPTESFARFCQQFGRSLRPASGKTAIIIDHVGNVEHFSRVIGLPDSDIEWTLDRREKARKGDRVGLVPQIICLGCTQPYPAIYKVCPLCGWENTITDRSEPRFVDGDLYELDPDVLDKLRKLAARKDAGIGIAQLGDLARLGATKQHALWTTAQQSLRKSLAWWAGCQQSQGLDMSQSYRKFYHQFGIDAESARVLGRPDTEALDLRVRKEIDTYVNSKVR